MSKPLQSFSMLLCLSAFSGGFALASPRIPAINVEAMQQTGTCTGVIKDAATGEPLVGASVRVHGSHKGTVTDLNGRFSLAGIVHGTHIEISSIGYSAKKVLWEGQPLDVTLQDNTHGLNELVVVGYGTQKKVNLTGAVGIVSSDALEDRPVTSVTQALQGEVPGLNLGVSNSGGALDGSMTMNIRGTGTIGDGSTSSPLVLIDGVEGDINAINPNDVASISVLKDASSASIYGARAAFGVVLVTTKSGKKGKTNVSYSGNVRFNHGIGIPEMANSVDFANTFNLAESNNGGTGVIFTKEQIQRMKDYMTGARNEDGSLKYPYGTIANSSGQWENWTGAFANTNWFDVFYKDWAASQEHNVSLNGGNEKTQWYISGNFMGQNGLLKPASDKLNRYTLNGKVTSQLAKWAKVTFNTRWIRKDFERPSYLTGLFFHNVARKWPIQPVYDPNGHFIYENEMEQIVNGGRQKNQADYLTNQLNFVFEPIKDWHINVEGTMRTYTSFQHYDVLPVYYYDVNGNAFPQKWEMGGDAYAPGSSRVNEYVYKENYYATNIYSDYSQTINKHYFKAMLGFNAEKYVTRNVSGQRDGLITPNVPTLDTANGESLASGGYDHTAVAGFFGRLNYSYDDKYLLEANLRYDGSARFGAGNRWAWFPSFSAGWNISREEFFQPLTSVVSNLKLRASWGELGNINTNDAWHPTYLSMPNGINYGWIIEGKLPSYSSNPGLVSSTLTWETVRTWDIGVDFGLFNNRLTGSFDYFVRKTLNMVGPAPELSSVLGTGIPKINNCDMKSYGFEFTIGWRDHIGDFKYGVAFNLSDAQQEITKYPNENRSLSSAYYVGQKLGEIWGLTTVGIAQSDEEMKNHLAKVDQSSYGSSWGAGDIMYADLNNDGKLNSGAWTVDDPGDYRVIGNSTPRYNFGLNLDAAWKGFDLRLFFQGTLKRDLWLDGSYFWGVTGGMWQSNVFKEHLDYWTPDNPNAYYPRPRWDGNNRYAQTRYLQNGAYARLKNITLGYSLPKAWVNKAGMQNVRIYISGENLLTFTSLSKIFDPENIGSLYGETGKTYPLQSTISVGINVNF